jgi:lysophospholipase L1-like esterase
LRVRLSNRYGASAVQIGGVRVARAGAGGSIASGTDKPLSFSGSEAVSIPPLSEVVSDPVTFDVAAGDQLSISLYMPGSVPTPTWHWLAIQTSYIAPGNQLSAQNLDTGVEVESSATQRTIALIGDSFTDGVGSSLDAHKRYPDALFARLQAAGKGMSVVNAGIATNRLLHDIVAPSLLNRLDSDALNAPGVSHVAVLVGANDLGIPGWLNRPGEAVTAEQLISGLTDIARRSHAKNQKAFVATITPFNGFALPGYYSDAAEAKRQAVNAWIRTNTVFDGVFDFDAVVRDPNDISKISAAFDSGDHFHPNDSGYAAMVNSIDLNRF